MSDKIITGFNLDSLRMPAKGGANTYSIIGDVGASFNLEVKNNAGQYYNFTTKTFQTAETKLQNKIIRKSGTFQGSIIFPVIDANDQYDFLLITNTGTRHTTYREVRDADNSIDVNASIGSNSRLLRKIVYQDVDVVLTISSYSSAGTTGLVASAVSDTITISAASSAGKISFETSCSTSSTSYVYRIKRQPTSDDILAFTQPVIVGEVLLPGENKWGGDARSTNKVVNGAVTSGANVTMDDDVGDALWAVGDRITGNAALDAKTGDNAVTVTAINVGSNAKVFTMSEEIAIDDDETLTFTQPHYYSWEATGIQNITAGMVVVGSLVEPNTFTSDYEDSITVNENTASETKIINFKKPTIDFKSLTPTISRGKVTAQAGDIVFNKQQPSTLRGVTLKVGGYGEGKIFDLYGYRVKFSDLKIELTPITTTTTAASTNSTTIAVADREGIINNISRVSGIGITTNPLVTAGGASDGAGNWTVGTAQTLESGATLTIENTGRTAKITGNIEILEAGAEDRTIRFDMDRLLSVN